MALQLSTGLRDAMLVVGPLADVMAGGKILIFGGAVPPSADSAQSSVVLCIVTDNGSGGGLNFETTAVNGVLAKSSSQDWLGTNLLGGLATHYRFVAPGDTGAASTSEPRIQGLVGEIAKDMNLSPVDLVSGAVTPLDYYTLALPG